MSESGAAIFWIIGLQIILTLAVGSLATYFITKRNKTLGEGREEARYETIHLANQTLPHLRQGLNEQTAAAAAQLIYEYTQAAGVAIVSGRTIVACVGEGSDHHRPGQICQTTLTEEVLRTGRSKVALNKAQIGCSHPDCPLSSAIVAPMKMQNSIVGCLKIYYKDNQPLRAGQIKVAIGLAQLMSTQMELAELDRKTERLAKAELQALQAQISPHFIFNTLNTIASFIRTKPDEARDLLVEFADFTRRTFQKRGEFSTFAQELEYVHQYLLFEKARFGDKLEVVYRIDPEILSTVMPVLTLQPLVENAVRHGIGKKIGPGKVVVSAEDKGNECWIAVADDGVGMTQEEAARALRHKREPRFGMGLSNVNERLHSIYGPEHQLQVESKPGEGTKVSFAVPKYKAGVGV